MTTFQATQSRPTFGRYLALSADEAGPRGRLARRWTETHCGCRRRRAVDGVRACVSRHRVFTRADRVELEVAAREFQRARAWLRSISYAVAVPACDECDYDDQPRHPLYY
ncbi:MAG: hypothetical protein ACYDGR_03635 [Candidatus Dormibacteria bacterium]